MPRCDTTLFRTVLQIEVLSVGPYKYIDLATLTCDVTEGDCSGAVDVIRTEVMTREAMAAALERQGSDPEFLLGCVDEVA